MTVLLFLSTIALFLTIDYFVRRSKKAPIPVRNLSHQSSPMRAPAGIFFTRSHTWMTLFPSGKVHLGIDDFLARMFSKPGIIFLKKNNETVAVGDPILRIDEGDNRVIVRSPINGTISSVNDELRKTPALLNDALFSEGWAYTITPNSTIDLRSFYLGDETKTWLRNEMGRLRDFFAGLTAPVPAMMQDGGMPLPGVMVRFTPEQCKKFENEFLNVD